jgi:hypothetical protein
MKVGAQVFERWMQVRLCLIFYSNFKNVEKIDFLPKFQKYQNIKGCSKYQFASCFIILQEKSKKKKNNRGSNFNNGNHGDQ